MSFRVFVFGLPTLQQQTGSKPKAPPLNHVFDVIEGRVFPEGAGECYGFQAVPTMSSPTSALHSVAKLFGTLFCTPTVPHVVLER